MLAGSVAPERMAAAFVARGWSARKSAWDEYEVAEKWADLRLFIHEGVCMASGNVFIERFDDLLHLLDELVPGYRGELYDSAGTAIRTFVFP